MALYGRYNLEDLLDPEVVDETPIHQNFQALTAQTAGLAGDQTFTGHQTVQVSADTTSILHDTPARATAGTANGTRHVLRAHSFDTLDHTRDFIWRARTTTNAGAGIVELLTSLDGGPLSTLWSVDSAGVLAGIATLIESYYANSWITSSQNVDLTNQSGVSFVFATAPITVTLPPPGTTKRPIWVFAVAGTASVVTTGGGVVGGSTDLTTGAIINGSVAAPDSFMFKSDGANWRA